MTSSLDKVLPDKDYGEGDFAFGGICDPESIFSRRSSFSREANEDQNFRKEVLPKRATVPLSSLNQQTPVAASLKVISQPPGVDLSDIVSYAYQTEPLGQVRVYIIDTGANTLAPVSH